VWFLVSGATDKNGYLFPIAHLHRATLIAVMYVGLDENAQVNGNVVVVDMSEVGPKHLTSWAVEELRSWNDFWQVSSSTTLFTCEVVENTCNYVT